MASIALFIGINLEEQLDSWDTYRKWGAPSLTDIFNGDYWGLITSNFLHVEIWHIAFNLYWLWVLGRKIEQESSKGLYILLILSSALVSSLAQLAFSDNTGIGLSGIGYALFGYIVVKSRTDEAYKNYLDRNTIYLFIGWLALCVVLTKTGAWNIGNAAHIGGLLWGALLAFTARYARPVPWAAGIVYLASLTALIFYGFFSTAYLSHRAYELHVNRQDEEAMAVYRAILKVDPDNEFAKVNLKQLEMELLQDKAYDLHAQEKYSEARQVYNQILNLDKEHEWAKENLRRLEVSELQQKASDLHSEQRLDEAVEVYNQILSIDRDNEWARQNLQNILSVRSPSTSKRSVSR
ncbi:MAG TPA: rhomboid family intramembrane serine protease [Chitinophagaceae bacterium]|nr:rhomboid family intramembrane serine protease [Chitinophagaceae bacterium]